MLEYHCKDVNDDIMTVEFGEDILFGIFNVDDNGEGNYNNVILSREQVIDMIAKIQSKLYK